MKVETVQGPAEVILDGPERPAFLLVLTHGSNSGVDVPDLLAVREVALGLGGAVAGVVQPFRVAGRRAPGSVARQDAAWLEVIGVLRGRFGRVPLVQCGRSNGARVACRTAGEAKAAGVVALAFPLVPPGKPPERSRAGELRQALEAGVEVLVVNGERDPFGVPDAADATEVTVLPGERHGPAKDLVAVGAAVEPFLRRWAAQDAAGMRGKRVSGEAG